MNAWTLTARRPDLALTDPVDYTDLTLVESYNLPDTLVVNGRTDLLRPILQPGYGCYLTDDTGAFRFSGWAARPERHGDGTCTLAFHGDLVLLRDFLCWPVPTGEWSTAGQTSDYDYRTGPAESRAIAYIRANMGSAARSERRVWPELRTPGEMGREAAQARGPSARTSARFNVLGELVASLAESADLRVTVVPAFIPTARYLDVTFSAVPDLSGQVQFGPPESGGLVLLDNSWQYALGIPAGTTMLSAAGGQGKDRILNAFTDSTAESLWGAGVRTRRIEQLVDQRETTDSGEIATGLQSALADAAGEVSVSAPITSGQTLQVGTDIPLGAKVTAILDGDVITERIRQITTQVGGDSPGVTPVFGDPTNGVVLTQRQLSQALNRISSLERNQ